MQQEDLGDHLDTLHFLILRQLQRSSTLFSSANIHHPSFLSKRIQATILDLNGHLVHPKLPIPVLRRTASGHLFQPRNQVVKAREIMDPVPTEEEEDEVLRRWAAGEEKESVVKEKRMEGKLVWEGSNKKGTSTELALRKKRLWCEGAVGDGCQDESRHHRCYVQGLVGLDRSESQTLPVGLGIVSDQEQFLGVVDEGDDEGNDVWVEVAKE
jgi:hypothetical protein